MNLTDIKCVQYGIIGRDNNCIHSIMIVHMVIVTKYYIWVYKNIHRVSKEFKLGQIVAHRQLQLATGVAMGMKPKHIGPYIIKTQMVVQQQ